MGVVWFTTGLVWLTLEPVKVVWPAIQTWVENRRSIKVGGLVRLAIEDRRPGWVAVVVTRFLVVDLVWLSTLIMTNKRERVSILTSKGQSIEP